VKDKAILLVEDNPDDEVLTRRALKKNNIGNEVVVARDGAEALDYLFGTGKYAERDADSSAPQLVLLDLRLPKINGLEVLQRLRVDERTKFLPVVILASSKEEQDMINGYSSYADSCICRPVDFAQFSRAVQQLKTLLTGIEQTPAEGQGHAA
jgi:two-component system response regulator